MNYVHYTCPDDAMHDQTFDYHLAYPCGLLRWGIKRIGCFHTMDTWELIVYKHGSPRPITHGQHDHNLAECLAGAAGLDSVTIDEEYLDCWVLHIDDLDPEGNWQGLSDTEREHEIRTVCMLLVHEIDTTLDKYVEGCPLSYHKSDLIDAEREAFIPGTDDVHPMMYRQPWVVARQLTQLYTWRNTLAEVGDAAVTLVGQVGDDEDNGRAIPDDIEEACQVIMRWSASRLKTD